MTAVAVVLSNTETDDDKFSSRTPKPLNSSTTQTIQCHQVDSNLTAQILTEFDGIGWMMILMAYEVGEHLIELHPVPDLFAYSRVDPSKKKTKGGNVDCFSSRRTPWKSFEIDRPMMTVKKRRIQLA
jgi:hypothetical protein